MKFTATFCFSSSLAWKNSRSLNPSLLATRLFGKI